MYKEVLRLRELFCFELCIRTSSVQQRTSCISDR
uniref:Uncharacterized protein n=1 Tax=Arabidopsis thaliana TaxID=3702 RepID=Q56X17_ARATH|nr:hypothetical protein [Arabidopsis thaliana]